MRNFLLTLIFFASLLFVVTSVSAQAGEPGVGLPLLDEETTVTSTRTSTTSGAVTTYSTVTPVSYATVATSSQEAVDDAETGSELIVLSILSLTGGVGLYLIKKFFDFKRYSI